MTFLISSKKKRNLPTKSDFKSLEKSGGARQIAFMQHS
jgi:hypothetical protein